MNNPFLSKDINEQIQKIYESSPFLENEQYKKVLKSIQIPNSSLNDFFNSYSYTINKNSVQQYPFNLISKNTKNLIDSFNKTNLPGMSAYNNMIISINKITDNNPFLGLSLTDTLNSVIKNGNFTTNNAIQNLVSAMGPETTKSVFESMNKIMDQNFDSIEETDDETRSVSDYFEPENDKQNNKLLDFQSIQDKFFSLPKSKREKIISAFPEITFASSDYFLRNYPLANYLVQIISIFMLLALSLMKDDE